MGASLTFRRVGLHVMLVTYSYVCSVGNCVSNDTFLHLICVVVCVVGSVSVCADTLGDAALSIGCIFFCTVWYWWFRMLKDVAESIGNVA